MGDEVTTIRPDGTSVTGKVQSVFVTSNQLVRVETEDGILITTPTQPLVPGRRRRSARPKTSSRATGSSAGQWQTPGREGSRCARTDRQDKVFNLVLGNSEVFVAGGFLARSKPPIVAVEWIPSTTPARRARVQEVKK